jgi:hypothetical protein
MIFLDGRLAFTLVITPLWQNMFVGRRKAMGERGRYGPIWLARWVLQFDVHACVGGA